MSIGKIMVLAVVVPILGCARIDLGVESYSLVGGEVVVEHYDDPFDNLKSCRLVWQGADGQRETIDELWGAEHCRGAREPTVIDVDPLALGFGQTLYRRPESGEWLRVVAEEGECPSSIRAVDLEASLIAEYALVPADCSVPVSESRMVQLISVEHGELDGRTGEEVVVRAQTCLMGSGGPDVSAVFTLECSKDDGDWSIVRLPVEEIPYDQGPGRPRYAPSLAIEDGRLTSFSWLFRSEASNQKPSWERKITYVWGDGRFAVDAVETRELDVYSTPR